MQTNAEPFANKLHPVTRREAVLGSDPVAGDTQQDQSVRCLLIASIFAPIHGGSAVVYESLCRYMPTGTMRVLAPWRHYLDGKEVRGWLRSDGTANYPVHRIELLRPVVSDPPKTRFHSLMRFLTDDVPLQFAALRTVFKIIRDYRINVVCIGELNSGSWLGIFAKRFLGCRMISYIHGEEITTDSAFRFYGRNRKQYLRAADAVVAVSEFTTEALQRMMEVPRSKIELIPNGVDIDLYTPGPRNEELLARLGARGKRAILTVGRLVPRKGMDITICALPAVLERIPDAHYLIVGDGPYRTDLASLVSEMNLTNSVTLVGRTSHADLVDLYRSCDLFVMPNREMPDGDTEGFGLVFLEANACGRAVVGGRAGGAVEAVRHGNTGLLVDGSQPGEIANAIITLLTNDSLRHSMERRGLQVALDSSTRERAAQFHGLCQRLVMTGYPGE